MKTQLLAAAVLAALICAAHADDAPAPAAPAAAPAPDGQWHGSGEAGLALASGNTKSQNINAKLALKKEDEQWKYDFFLDAQRNKADAKTYYVIPPATPGGQATIGTGNSYELTSNRYDAGASAGYKLDDRSYIVGALRYEHDAFSPYRYQYTLSVGYGYQFLKNASDELSAEVGPGYKVLQPMTVYIPDRFVPDKDRGAVARGLVNYKHHFNDSTSFIDTFLVEAGSDNTYLQNDAAIQVKMTDKLALKAGYEVRYNNSLPDGTSDSGFKKTDQLLTTNLVYGF